jgi:hypothetical protein
VRIFLTGGMAMPPSLDGRDEPGSGGA